MIRRFACIICICLALGWGMGTLRANTNERVHHLIEQARQGNIQAMCELVLAYYHGDGALKDPFKAKCWARRAWNRGSDRAEKLWNAFELWQYSGRCDLFFDNETLPEKDSGDILSVNGISMVWVAGGCYNMGCHKKAGKCHRDERPVHRVCVGGFWMGQFEVTQDQWGRVMGSNPSRFKRGGDYPVEQVSFYDALSFIKKLNRKTGKKFFLPTEAQWEYACRSRGKKRPYPWEEEAFRPGENCGACDAGRFRGRTAPGGSFGSNDLGIYDLGGNVREWCRDRYGRDAYEIHEKDNPLFRKDRPSRVVRGGCFADNLGKLRCTSRSRAIPDLKSELIGFRLVLSDKG